MKNWQPSAESLAITLNITWAYSLVYLLFTQLASRYPPEECKAQYHASGSVACWGSVESWMSDCVYITQVFHLLHWLVFRRSKCIFAKSPCSKSPCFYLQVNKCVWLLVSSPVILALPWSVVLWYVQRARSSPLSLGSLSLPIWLMYISSSSHCELYDIWFLYLFRIISNRKCNCQSSSHSIKSTTHDGSWFDWAKYN